MSLSIKGSKGFMHIGFHSSMVFTAAVVYDQCLCEIGGLRTDG